MTNCTSSSLEFPACRKRRVAADFSGGDITSNGGVLLLRQADRLSGLTASVARRLIDARQRGKVEHRFVAMLRQRVFGLALGYEDVNDHAALRHDLALQTAAERDCALASPSTLSRFENAAGRDWAWNIHEVLVEDFIASHSEAPEELILDFDATDDAVHGRQVGRFFHGYYDHYCFLPLYVFCGERLLVSYLRPSKIDGAKHAWAILALLVKRLRQAWPGVRIVLRGDSGFCRHKMLSWCERQGVGYIVGLAKNARLNDLAAPWMETAAQHIVSHMRCHGQPITQHDRLDVLQQRDHVSLFGNIPIHRLITGNALGLGPVLPTTAAVFRPDRPCPKPEWGRRPNMTKNVEVDGSPIELPSYRTPPGPARPAPATQMLAIS